MRIQIDFIYNPVDNHIPHTAHSTAEIEIIPGKIAKLLRKGRHQRL